MLPIFTQEMADIRKGFEEESKNMRAEKEKVCDVRHQINHFLIQRRLVIRIEANLVQSKYKVAILFTIFRSLTKAFLVTGAKASRRCEGNVRNTDL